MPKKLTARALAARILLQVLQQHRSLNTALHENLGQCAKVQDRGFIQELCYGVLRWHLQLDATLQALMAKPLKAADGDIYCLLLLGLYQLQHLNTKAHAAIFETAQAARELKKLWAVGLINGVLRALQRQAPALQEKLAQAPPEVQFAHPAWLIENIEAAWPQDWRAILHANNARAPLTLRVNQRQISRSAYLEKLAALQIAAEPTISSTMGVRLLTPQDVTQLPGYAEGEFSVQDEAAQFAAELLDLQPGQRVLDACAAPGGKTAHMLEIEPKIAHLLALDSDKQRLTRVEENLKRLRLLDSNQVALSCADAAEPDSWWNGELFDRILVDAPCSATGVIRRHPDIKHLRRPEDIAALNVLQLQLLSALWPLLRPGGILLYATCSMLPQENHLLLQTFLEQRAEASAMPFQLEESFSTAVGQQIIVGSNDRDGFYYGKITKL